MAGSAPKRKGDGYERELAKYLNEKIFGGDDKVQRMPLSGGGAVKSSGGSDLKNTPCIFVCLLYTSPSPRDVEESRMPSSA